MVTRTWVVLALLAAMFAAVATRWLRPGTRMTHGDQLEKESQLADTALVTASAPGFVKLGPPSKTSALRAKVVEFFLEPVEVEAGERYLVNIHYLVDDPSLEKTGSLEYAGTVAFSGSPVKGRAHRFTVAAPKQAPTNALSITMKVELISVDPNGPLKGSKIRVFGVGLAK